MFNIVEKILKSSIDNKYLVTLKSISLKSGVLLLLLTLLLTATPTLIGKISRSYQSDFPQIEDTIKDVLQNADCEITNQTLICNNIDTVVLNGEYEVSFFLDDKTLDKSKIVFNETTVLIVYKKLGEVTTYKEMNYSKFTNDYKFSEVASQLKLNQESDLFAMSESFMLKLYHSTSLQEILIIASEVSTITLGLILATTILFMSLNIGKLSAKIKLIESFNIVLINYATVAFWVALFALFTSPAIAQWILPFLIVIRLGFSYFYLSNESKIEFKNDDEESETDLVVA